MDEWSDVIIHGGGSLQWTSEVRRSCTTEAAVDEAVVDERSEEIVYDGGGCGGSSSGRAK